MSAKIKEKKDRLSSLLERTNTGIYDACVDSVGVFSQI